MRDTLIEKLRPDRFSAMSGKMAAIVGYILTSPSPTQPSASWSSPVMASCCRRPKVRLAPTT